MLPPARNHRISPPDAAALTRRYRETHPRATLGGRFRADQVRSLLAQDGCMGLRYYHARSKADEPALVLVGADASGNDMEHGVVLEFNFPCPPFCALPSSLNAFSAASPAPRVYRGRDHRIALAEAAAYTRRYRDKAVEPMLGGFYHADQVRELLAQPACTGLRFYYARTESDQPTLVLVGSDAEHADMEAGVVLEFNFPCPPFCAAPSALNGRRTVSATRVPAMAE